MMSGKLGTSANKMVYPEGTFLWWRLFTPSFKPIAYIVDKQKEVCRNTFCYRDYVCQVSKLQHICNRFNTSFYARNHKTNQAISNLNRKFWNKSTLGDLGGFSSDSLLFPMLQQDYEFEKPYLHLNSHKYLASCIYDLFVQSLF